MVDGVPAPERGEPGHPACRFGIALVLVGAGVDGHQIGRIVGEGVPPTRRQVRAPIVQANASGTMWSICTADAARSRENTMNSPVYGLRNSPTAPLSGHFGGDDGGDVRQVPGEDVVAGVAAVAAAGDLRTASVPCRTELRAIRYRRRPVWIRSSESSPERPRACLAATLAPGRYRHPHPKQFTPIATITRSPAPAHTSGHRRNCDDAPAA